MFLAPSREPSNAHIRAQEPRDAFSLWGPAHFATLLKKQNAPFRRRRGAERLTRRARRRPEAARKKKWGETMAMPATQILAPPPAPPVPSSMLPTAHGPSNRQPSLTQMQGGPFLRLPRQEEKQRRVRRGIASRLPKSLSSSFSTSSRPVAPRPPPRGRTSSWRRSPRTRPAPRAEKEGGEQKQRRKEEKRRARAERPRSGRRTRPLPLPRPPSGRGRRGGRSSQTQQRRWRARTPLCVCVAKGNEEEKEEERSSLSLSLFRRKMERIEKCESK